MGRTLALLLVTMVLTFVTFMFGWASLLLGLEAWSNQSKDEIALVLVFIALTLFLGGATLLLAQNI